MRLTSHSSGELTDTGRTGDTSGDGGVMALAMVVRPVVTGRGGELERRVAVLTRVGTAGAGVGALAFLTDLTDLRLNPRTAQKRK